MRYLPANDRRTAAAFRRFRFDVAVIASMLIAFASGQAAAQVRTLEAAYVVLGGEGAVARAIVSGGAECPVVTIGDASNPMRVRATPDAGSQPAFPVLVCEALIPPGTVSASIEGRPLPLPPTKLASIAAFGDTGCRLKDYRQFPIREEHEKHLAGRFQDCDRLSKWPFSLLSKTVAVRKPDLVIHVGDYLYRESPCPKGDQGCAGSPYGDNWRTWQADFFTPAAPLLAAAPWIMARGNHEICARAGAGFFRFLEPRLTQGDSPPRCTDFLPPDMVNVAGKSFIVMDSSDAKDSCDRDACDSAPYAAQFASLKPAPGSVLVGHRPIWGIGRNFTLNRTLQQALSAWNGRLPDGIELALAGHMHIFEILSFEDNRSPQLVVGTGGTALDRKITRRLKGIKLGGATVSYGRTEHNWGFTVLAPHDSGWTATFVTFAGRPKFACTIERMQAKCNSGASRP